MTWYRQFESYSPNSLTIKKSIWQEFFDSHAPDYRGNLPFDESGWIGNLEFVGRHSRQLEQAGTGYG
jgi:hypothetical protein